MRRSLLLPIRRRRLATSTPPVIALAAALLFAACSGGQTPTGQGYVNDARAALDAGRLAEARALAELATEAKPAPPEAPRVVAEVQRALGAQARDEGELQAAFDHYVAAAQVEPSRLPRAADLLAAVAVGRDAGVDPERLAALAERAIEATPSDTEARRAAAGLRDELGQAEAAAAHYLWLWEADRTQIPVGLRLGQLYLKAGRARDARAVLDRVLAADPGNVQAKLQRAEAFEALGEQEAARRAYETLLEAHPDNASVAFRYADFLERRGDAERADAVRQRAREQMPGVERREMRRLR